MIWDEPGGVGPPAAERCPSGLRSTPGERVCAKAHRGFESRPLRHPVFATSEIRMAIPSPAKGRGTVQALFATSEIRMAIPRSPRRTDARVPRPDEPRPGINSSRPHCCSPRRPPRGDSPRAAPVPARRYFLDRLPVPSYTDRRYLFTIGGRRPAGRLCRRADTHVRRPEPVSPFLFVRCRPTPSGNHPCGRREA